MKKLTYIGIILLFICLGSVAQAQFIYEKGSTWSIVNFQNGDFSNSYLLFDQPTPVKSAPVSTHYFAAPAELSPYSLDYKCPEPPTNAVPEPSTYGILGALLLTGLIILRRRHM